MARVPGATMELQDWARDYLTLHFWLTNDHRIKAVDVYVACSKQLNFELVDCDNFSQQMGNVLNAVFGKWTVHNNTGMRGSGTTHARKGETRYFRDLIWKL